MKIKSFDLAKPVIDEVGKKNNLKWDEEKVDILKGYCDVIDVFTEKFDATTLEVELDEIIGEISFSLVSSNIEVYDAKTLFYEMIDRATEFSFLPKGDDVEFKLSFPSLLA